MYSIDRASPLKRKWRKRRLVFWEWWKKVNRLDHTATYEEMITMLRRGVDQHGKRINVKEFDRTSTRTLANLYQELKTLDMVLVFNPKTRRIERHAQKVTVLIINTKMKLHWLEVARKYPNGEEIKKEQTFTIRETRKRGQTSIKAVLSGLEQELGYFPRMSEIIPCDAFERPDRHESSVYTGLLSVDVISPYQVESETFFRKDGHHIKDYGDEEPANDNWVEIVINCYSHAV